MSAQLLCRARLIHQNFQRSIRSVAMMARLDVDSKYRMPSGYEIPVLGYGVYQTYTPFDLS